MAGDDLKFKQNNITATEQTRKAQATGMPMANPPGDLTGAKW